ncbi:TPA: IS3 family transposase [Klebsiella pneumoniae]|nr:IS3 family transposase [Klebsiella pneumoniae]
MADLLTYGYRRVWALLRRESKRDDLVVVNAKWVYLIMRAQNLLRECKSADPCRNRAHQERVAEAESNRRWCSDRFEFLCENDESCG